MASTPSIADTAPQPEIVLRLYVAGNSPHSERARYELNRICTEHFPTVYRIEIVDVWEHPEIALADRVFATPALRRLAPGPSILIFGDLSQTQQVLTALGIQTRT